MLNLSKVVKNTQLVWFGLFFVCFGVRGAVARGYLAARGYLVRDIRGGTLHADISHPADISHFYEISAGCSHAARGYLALFCNEISAGDLARGYLVTSDCNLHPLY